MLKDVYLGDWCDEQDLLSEFQIDKAEIKEYKVIIAYYSYEDYSGTAFVLLKKGHKYYEVHGSHCSCYGLEGQWEPEETARLALKRRVEQGEHYGAFAACTDAIKQHFRW